MLDIIEKKKSKLELTKEELKYVIDGYVNNEIPDYQMSSLLMAILLNGMTEEETINLTMLMKNSGDVLDLSKIDGSKVDKHSTGGVGDKTTLILAPLVASTGVKVAKMSGRGLGHTGGTIDKLESIPGFKTAISIEQMISQVNDIGIAVVGQTGNLVPADKKIYALRDVTGTVDSIPLIAASIMSKKLASDNDKIVIDVKVGNGALMKNIEDARSLAHLMVKIGDSQGKETVCILTNMEEPLGFAIGNSVEVIESINTLNGKGPSDLVELVETLGSYMVSLGKNISLEAAKSEVIQNLNNGKAYDKFLEMVKFQGGDIKTIKSSKSIMSIKSPKEGYIKYIDALELGEIARSIGAGRLKKDDIIDYSVGLILNKKVGDYINKDEELLKIHLNDKGVNISKLLDCFVITTEKCDKQTLIYEIIK